MAEVAHAQRPGSLEADGTRRKVHPADAPGRFLRARRRLFAALLLFWIALPLVPVGGRPAVFLDVPARAFHLFGTVFNAQDFWRLALVLVAAVLVLLLATAWLGRVWCGWACPQTVLLEGLYRPVERWIEGTREQRRRLDAAPWTAGKLARKAAKQVIFVLLSLAVAHVALAFFATPAGVVSLVRGSPGENALAFGWTMAGAALFWADFAWFREQLCLAVCPYGRLQGALVDRDTVTIGYDAKRGEPRAKKSRAPDASPKGDCVDCDRCVVVCPTAIDIRHGPQMECLACAQCADACDEVMKRLGRAPGLIRYDSQAGLEGGARRVLRPRLYLYGALLLAVLAALVATSVARAPFEANLLRAPGLPWSSDAGRLRNRFTLHLVNKRAERTVLRIQVSTSGPAEVALPQSEIALETLQHYHMPVIVSVPAAAPRKPLEIRFAVRDALGGEERTMAAPFLQPAR